MFLFDELQESRGLGLLDQLERRVMLERREQAARDVVGLTRAERALQDLFGILDATLVDVFEGDRALVRLLNDGVALLE